MSGSITDRITDTRNAARPTSTTVSSTRSASGTSLACASLTGWPTASKVHFVTYRIDSNSNPVAGTQLDCYGIVTGNTIGSFTVVDGTDAGNSVGDVVEMLPTAAWGQDLSDGLLSQHTRTGAHGAITGTSISVSGNLTSTGGAVSTDTVSEHTAATGVTVDGLLIKDSALGTNNSVVTANITADAVTDAKLIYGKLRSRQGGSATNWQTTGTTTYDYSATDVFMQSGSVACTSGAVTVTFPTAFNQIPHVIGTTTSAGTVNVITVVKSITATNFVIYQIKTDGTGATTESANWLAIGQ